ncbi:MAG TPA: DUF305 domain-containing protein [Candidatus Acidoferrum sp.]|nr:DUF305 domain-containing protein [Candidatus Acidoferrum sp.]
MNKQPILYGITGLFIGIVISWAVTAVSVNNNYTALMRVMDLHITSAVPRKTMTNNNDMTMGQMVTGLQGKTGDNFDKAFLSEMIPHHQGAIDMANLAKMNAKHNEIKNMADNIIASQTAEVNQMELWQGQWGYKASTNTDMNAMMGN